MRTKYEVRTSTPRRWSEYDGLGMQVYPLTKTATTDPASYYQGPIERQDKGSDIDQTRHIGYASSSIASQHSPKSRRTHERKVNRLISGNDALGEMKFLASGKARSVELLELQRQEEIEMMQAGESYTTSAPAQ